MGKVLSAAQKFAQWGGRACREVDRSEPEPIAVEAAAEDEGCAGCGEKTAPVVVRRGPQKTAEKPRKPAEKSRKRAETPITEEPSPGEDGEDEADDEAAPADTEEVEE